MTLGSIWARRRFLAADLVNVAADRVLSAAAS
jgi:hypothetical protein